MSRGGPCGRPRKGPRPSPTPLRRGLGGVKLKRPGIVSLCTIRASAFLPSFLLLSRQSPEDLPDPPDEAGQSRPPPGSQDLVPDREIRWQRLAESRRQPFAIGHLFFLPSSLPSYSRTPSVPTTTKASRGSPRPSSWIDPPTPPVKEPVKIPCWYTGPSMRPASHTLVEIPFRGRRSKSVSE